MARQSGSIQDAHGTTADMVSSTKPESDGQRQAPNDRPSSGLHALAASLVTSPVSLYSLAFLLRLVLLLYGLYQDAHSPLKYTDIDYLVFTDAARFVHQGRSPYDRETYRYTPLLAWMLLPTAWETRSPLWNVALFSSGKVLFAVADLVAGGLVEAVLRMGEGPARPGMSAPKARMYAAIWLLNPMVATISTRGSSEGLLAVLVMALLWAVLSRRVALAGVLLGFGVHFKIYPFIYAPAIVWWMDSDRMGRTATGPGSRKAKASRPAPPTLLDQAAEFVTADRITLTLTSLGTFLVLNVAMLTIYGFPFLQHTYLHHITRIDHRHNFSPYNTQLYLSSAESAHTSPPGTTTPSNDTNTNIINNNSLKLESLAFLPQLLLSTLLLPLFLAKRSLPGTMLAQTFAFAAFNKVCTSQYFLWYLVLLPLYLPRSSLAARPRRGLAALAAWVAAQALWLFQAYRLEFLGRSTFVPGLWVAGLAFFAVNCAILGVIVEDIARA